VVVSSLLFQTGLMSLVGSGLLLLFRLIDVSNDLMGFQQFAKSTVGLVLMVLLFLYGLFGMIYGLINILKVLKKD